MVIILHFCTKNRRSITFLIRIPDLKKCYPSVYPPVPPRTIVYQLVILLMSGDGFTFAFVGGCLWRPTLVSFPSPERIDESADASVFAGADARAELDEDCDTN